MYGAISLINNQKPIMQLQHMNRQISTSLFKRTNYFLGVLEFICQRIANWNFEPIDDSTAQILYADLLNWPSYLPFLINISIYTFTFYYKITSDKLFPHKQNYLYLLLIIFNLIIFICFDMGYTNKQYITMIFKITLFTSYLLYAFTYMRNINNAISNDFYYNNFLVKFVLFHAKHVPLTKSHLIFYRKLKPTEENIPTSIEVKTGDVSKTYYPLYHATTSINEHSAVSFVKPEDIKDLNKRHICVTPRKVLIQDFLDVFTLLQLLLKQQKADYIKIAKSISMFVNNLSPGNYPDLIDKFTIKTFLPFIFKHLYYLDNVIYKFRTAELVKSTNSEILVSSEIDPNDDLILEMFIELSPIILETLESSYNTSLLKIDLIEFFSKYQYLKKKYGVSPNEKIPELTVEILFTIILFCAIEEEKTLNIKEFTTSLLKIFSKHNSDFKKQ
jgi:hypothetical protein